MNEETEKMQEMICKQYELKEGNMKIGKDE